VGYRDAVTTVEIEVAGWVAIGLLGCEHGRSSRHVTTSVGHGCSDEGGVAGQVVIGLLGRGVHQVFVERKDIEKGGDKKSPTSSSGLLFASERLWQRERFAK
jgi:hypothetical protein